MTTRSERLLFAVFCLALVVGLAWFRTTDTASAMFMALAHLADAYPRQFIAVGLIMGTSGGLYALVYIFFTTPGKPPNQWLALLGFAALKMGLGIALWGAFALSYHR